MYEKGYLCMYVYIYIYIYTYIHTYICVGTRTLPAKERLGARSAEAGAGKTGVCEGILTDHDSSNNNNNSNNNNDTNSNDNNDNIVIGILLVVSSNNDNTNSSTPDLPTSIIPTNIA